MRPALRAGLLPLWRDRDTIQIGVDPRRAIALTGAGAVAALIGLLDGSRDRAQFVAAAAELGIPVKLAERMLALLAAAGVLVDFPASLVAGLTDEQRPLLLSELASASLARMDSDGGAQVFARRSAAVVHVCGSGNLAAAIADLLTASGLRAISGQLTVTEGKPSRSATGPALVVLAGAQPPGSADELRRRRQPHLAVSAAEAIGTVGPLIRPGVTACLRCMDLHRAERDPAWPLILAQLAGRQPQPAACSASLTAAVAAQAAARVLDFIDRPTAAGAAENATLELIQPEWQWRRRTWTPHPACICLAAPG